MYRREMHRRITGAITYLRFVVDTAFDLVDTVVAAVLRRGWRERQGKPSP